MNFVVVVGCSSSFASFLDLLSIGICDFVPIHFVAGVVVCQIYLFHSFLFAISRRYPFLSPDFPYLLPNHQKGPTFGPFQRGTGRCCTIRTSHQFGSPYQHSRRHQRSIESQVRSMMSCPNVSILYNSNILFFLDRRKLPLLSTLHCVLSAFRALERQGGTLNIDLTVFNNHLFEVMFDVCGTEDMLRGTLLKHTYVHVRSSRTLEGRHTMLRLGNTTKPKTWSRYLFMSFI